MDDVRDKGELARVIERFTKKDGTYQTVIPALRFIRASHTSEPVHSVYEPSLCIVAQGSKLVMLGNEDFQYGVGSYLTASVHLPITGQVVEASRETPYLSLQLQLDMKQILDIIRASDQEAKHDGVVRRGLMINHMNDTIYDATLRFVRLLETPHDIPILAPTMMREMVYRVLQNDQGEVLRQFALMGSHTQRIAKVIKRLNQDFSLPLRIEKLAEEATMSPSSLYYYFKKITAMSPLQYQKRLRLQEARRLLLSHQVEAAEAAFQVGYESPSHFSRDYARLFSEPPKRDIRYLRETMKKTIN
ncbi:AraC family transcriptional regulator [Bacillus sp. JCM 19041]|uniref:AraC family transcriptional regulator n=1 Tax=Bacillus sp. JCM 19041 TaxID=1460637 RepID=UPI0006D202E2